VGIDERRWCGLQDPEGIYCHFLFSWGSFAYDLGHMRVSGIFYDATCVVTFVS
jgi:hypothetical protein